MRALRRRSKSQPPPAWAIYEALSDPIADQARREWLDLRDGELPPRVVQAVFPSLVVWASLWSDRPDDQIRLRLHRSRQLHPPRPDHPAADLTQQQIRRRPVLGGLINEYEQVV